MPLKMELLVVWLRDWSYHKRLTLTCCHFLVYQFCRIGSLSVLKVLNCAVLLAEPLKHVSSFAAMLSVLREREKKSQVKPDHDLDVQ